MKSTNYEAHHCAVFSLIILLVIFTVLLFSSSCSKKVFFKNFFCTYFEIMIFCVMLIICAIGSVMRNSCFIWGAVSREEITPEANCVPQSVLFIHFISVWRIGNDYFGWHVCWCGGICHSNSHPRSCKMGLWFGSTSEPSTDSPVVETQVSN